MDIQIIKAARRDLLQDVIKLVNQGVDINSFDEDGYTALYHAVSNQNFEMSKYLLERGVEVNRKYSKKKFTLLHLCGEYNLIEIARILIKYKIDINAKDKYGNNSLWTAVFNANNKGDLVKLLLENGADASSKNESGKSPLWLSEEIGEQEVIKLFKNWQLG